MNIYELTQDMIEIQEMLEDPELDIDEQTLLHTFEGVKGAFEDKCDNYCKLIKANKTYEEILREEKRNIDARIKKYEDIQIKLKSILKKAIQATGRNKLNTLHYNINRFNDKSLVYIDGVPIPDEYKTKYTTKKKNDTLVRKALDNGKKLSFAKYTDSCTVSTGRKKGTSNNE